MSRSVDGALGLLKTAEERVEARLREGDSAERLAFTGTAFHLPLACAVHGFRGGALTEARTIIEHGRRLVEQGNPGLGALLAAEIICAVGDESDAGGPWVGFVPDAVLRALGVQFADGRIAGLCVMVGAPTEPTQSAALVRQAQERNLLTLICGGSSRGTVLGDLVDQGINAGLETFVVPLGSHTETTAHAAGIMARLALIFGRMPPGSPEQLLAYCRERVKAISLVLSPPEPGTTALLSGLSQLGVTIGALAPAGGLDEVSDVLEPSEERIVADVAEARGIKVSVTELDVPVPFGPAFEGERVRREEMHAEFGGKASTAFELLLTAPSNQVVDGEISVTGPDLNEMPRGTALPLGLVVRVAGSGMQQVFEPVLERHFHAFLNQASGLFHVGQRSLCWLRVSTSAYEAGLRLRGLGTILHGMLHKTFGRFVDRVAVEITTSSAEVARMLPTAQEVYARRDRRIAGLTDEGVDTYYSCALCQSFAPTHLCIVKPERMGLCGAYTWLDARACHEMDPTGPNQPVAKGVLLDEERGEWQGVNDFISAATNGAHERFCAYSALHFPETSCGCFECIVAVAPEANGFLVVNREYDGMTPIGMGFGTLAGAVGGGQQNPGFMGVARRYLGSPKFVRAEGGLVRVVWMPRELKDALREELEARATAQGHPQLLEQIADETHATDLPSLLQFLEDAGHPALAMPPLL